MTIHLVRDAEREHAYRVTNAEITLIGAALIDPGVVPEIRARVTPDLFSQGLHRYIATALFALHDEGRQPSVEALLARLPEARDEIAPGETLGSWLFSVARKATDWVDLPWRDAIETLVDVRLRERLSAIGTALLHASNGPLPTLTIARTAMDELDGEMALLRPTRRLVYTAHEAGDAVFAQLDAGKPDWPTTGFIDLDRMLGGWPRGLLSVIGGRPGMGKSAFATSTLVRGWRQRQQNAVMFSLEMNRTQIGARVLCDLAYVRDAPIFVDDVLFARIDDRQRGRLHRAHDELRDSGIIIDEQAGMSMADIETRTRKIANDLAKKGKRLDVALIDHMGLIASQYRPGFNRVQEMTQISGGMLALAKELDIAVVSLSQLNRGVEGRENKRPDLGDLRESGSIEQDAATVLFLYRAAYYLAKQKHDDHEAESERLNNLAACENLLEVIISKNRNSGVGVQKMFCAIGSNVVRDSAYGL